MKIDKDPTQNTRPEKERRLQEYIKNHLDKMADSKGYEIENGVKEIVGYLNLLGISTSSSCEGHVERAAPFPWVGIDVALDPEFEIVNTVRRDARNKANEEITRLHGNEGAWGAAEYKEWDAIYDDVVVSHELAPEADKLNVVMRQKNIELCKKVETILQEAKYVPTDEFSYVLRKVAWSFDLEPKGADEFKKIPKTDIAKRKEILSKTRNEFTKIQNIFQSLYLK